MSKIKVIYLLPELKGASGGAKVIYNHSVLLNKINKNIDSQIIHLKKNLIYKLELSLAKRVKFFNKNLAGWNAKKMKINKNFIPNKNWFSKKIKLSKDLNFDPKNNFIIIPEIWAHFADNFLIKRKIKYSIFVQGFYHMNSFYNHKKLFESYKKAEFIITTSKETHKCLEYIFPDKKNKILKVNLSFDHKKFKIPNKKNNLITFMPRKLADHFHILSLFLFNKLPKKWKMESLNNLDEKKLFSKLSKSKIFMSFSYTEGFGMPPLEAAIAGNKVIGYTGGGGKEYWQKPIFEEIQTGDIKNFSEKILNAVNNLPENWHKKTWYHRKKLASKYSNINEKKLIKKLVSKICSYY